MGHALHGLDEIAVYLSIYEIGFRSPGPGAVEVHMANHWVSVEITTETQACAG